MDFSKSGGLLGMFSGGQYSPQGGGLLNPMQPPPSGAPPQAATQAAPPNPWVPPVPGLPQTGQQAQGPGAGMDPTNLFHILKFMGFGG